MRRIVAIAAIGLLVALNLAPAVYAQVTGEPPGAREMDGEAIITVSAAVVALTQLVKWGGLPDRYGPFAVLLIAALGIGLWAFSQGYRPQDVQALTWPLFAGWIAVSTSAAGVFGFTRAAASAVASAKPPPSGAAQNPTTP